MSIAIDPFAANVDQQLAIFNSCEPEVDPFLSEERIVGFMDGIRFALLDDKNCEWKMLKAIQRFKSGELK